MSTPAHAAIEVVVASRPGDSIEWPGPSPTVAATPGPPEVAYLRHVCENYDRLAEVTVFLPSDAVARYPWLPERVRGLSSGAAFRALGGELIVEDLSDLPRDHARRLAEICANWSLDVPDIVSCRAGSMFAVARRQLVSRPHKTYEWTLEQACSDSEVPGLLERLWHVAFDEPGTWRGVVTAADAPIFRDLQFLILSLRAHDDVPVLVYDLGLGTHELHWCLSQPNVMCRQIPPLTPAMARYVGSHRWQAWLKPAYLLDAPFDQLLWIDADCVVLSSLADAFARFEAGPLLLPEVCPGSGRNHLRLYDFLPVANSGRPEVEINNGVIGMDRHRDRELLSAWLYAVEWAIKNEGHRHLLRWYDQGAMVWAIRKTALQDRVAADQTWNYPAQYGSDVIRHAVDGRRGVLGAIRDFYPEARIVHWFGLNKLSVALDREVRDLFIGRNGPGEDDSPAASLKA